MWCPLSIPENENSIQENHSEQRNQVVPVSDTLGKCPQPGSLKGWLLTPLWCGVHSSTAHCLSHGSTLSLLSNTLSLLLLGPALSSPPAPICSTFSACFLGKPRELHTNPDFLLDPRQALSVDPVLTPILPEACPTQPYQECSCQSQHRTCL